MLGWDWRRGFAGVRATETAQRARVLGLVMFVAFAATASLAAASAVTAGPPAAEAETFRPLAVYAPSRPFDHQHMRLSLEIADMETPRLEAVMELTVSPIGTTRDRLGLDAENDSLTIRSVTIDGRAAAFTHEQDRLEIAIPPTAPGQPVTVTVTYTGENMGLEGCGLNWFRSRPERDEHAQIHTQGQANWNRRWFPCHDAPNERLTTELLVTAPDPYIVISNGRLMEQTPAGPGAGGAPRTRWHWRQEGPHPAYLVSLVVGRFDRVEVGGEGTARPGLAMPVYGPPGSAERLREVFGPTPAMIAFYEQWFDEPYPWAQYAQVVVRNFRWGGMENTAASTFGEFTTRARGEGDAARAHEDLIAHEVAHQWLGNLVTCKSWEHLWLNEGWATYAEGLWFEHRDGPEAYQRRVRRWLDAMVRADAGPDDRPLASTLFAGPDDLFTQPDDPYAKGALILHMLRARVGVEAFQRGTRVFINRFRFGHVETDDFRKVMEEISGESLQGFFEQWVRRAGIPRMDVRLEWIEADGHLAVVIEQTQAMSPQRPAYDVGVPLWIDLPQASGEVDRRVVVRSDRRLVEQRISLPARPTRVQVDPTLAVAADYRVRDRASTSPAAPEAEAPTREAR